MPLEPMPIETLPQLFKRIAQKNPEVIFQMSREENAGFLPTTYSQAYQIVLNFGAALFSMGVSRGEHIGLISDNRKEWQHADLGLLAIGAIDVPRGSDASVADLSYILSFSECKIVIAENSFIVKKIAQIKSSLPLLKTLICFDALDEEAQKIASESDLEILMFQDLLQVGKNFNEQNPQKIESELQKGKVDELATIIFTSGTTGTPKGVMLSHRNFVTQLDELRERIWLLKGERAILVLPIWHVYERACEYVILCQAATLCYSKPLGTILLADLQELNPALLPAVPRVYEAIYDGIFRKMRKAGKFQNAIFKFFVSYAIFHAKIGRAITRKKSLYHYDFLPLWWIFAATLFAIMFPLKALGDVLVFKKIRELLGKKFRAGISGGGAYPSALDNFFWAIGIKIVEGYGLTETSPIVSVRPVNAPIFGNVGSALRNVNARIVDLNGHELPRCKKGILEIKGDTVMVGYYKQPELTAKTINAEGWLNTGDLAILTQNGEISLRGRIKDTIVLRGGENVEPLPIEMKIMESQFIKTAVVIGNDQRSLTALIVCDQEELKNFAQNAQIPFENYEKLLAEIRIKKLIEKEIRERINILNGFKIFELINRFTLLPNEFQVGRELSSKQEISRHKITEIYKKQIKAMYS